MLRLVVFAVGLQLTATYAAELRGRVLDADSRELLAARIYVQSVDGGWHHVQSADVKGSAAAYSKVRKLNSAEVHTCVSPHPFVAEVPAGGYTITVERGKEFTPVTKKIVVTDDEPLDVTIEIQRRFNMAVRGWYSGDTHVHRTLEEIPTCLMADDINVALPLTQWVTL